MTHKEAEMQNLSVESDTKERLVGVFVLLMKKTERYVVHK